MRTIFIIQVLGNTSLANRVTDFLAEIYKQEEPPYGNILKVAFNSRDEAISDIASHGVPGTVSPGDTTISIDISPR